MLELPPIQIVPQLPNTVPTCAALRTKGRAARPNRLLPVPGCHIPAQPASLAPPTSWLLPFLAPPPSWLRLAGAVSTLHPQEKCSLHERHCRVYYSLRHKRVERGENNLMWERREPGKQAARDRGLRGGGWSSFSHEPVAFLACCVWCAQGLPGPRGRWALVLVTNTIPAFSIFMSWGKV